MPPIAHQPGPGGLTSQLVGSVVLRGTAAPAVPPARNWETTPAGPGHPARWTVLKAHAGIDFTNY
jgi:hypothetical protein